MASSVEKEEEVGNGDRNIFVERLSAVLFKGAAILILPSVAVIVTTDTILRYLFSAPLAWSQDAVGVSMFLMFTACLPHAWHAGVHVRLDMFYNKLKPSWRRLVDGLSSLCALAMSVLLAYRSALVALDAARSGLTTPSGAIPLAPVAGLAAIFFLLFALTVVASMGAIRTGES